MMLQPSWMLGAVSSMCAWKGWGRLSMNPLIREIGGVIVMHRVKGFVELVQPFEHSFFQSYVLSPAWNTTQCSVLESTRIFPVCAIRLSMHDRFLLDSACYAFESLAHPSEHPWWLNPLKLRLDQIYSTLNQRSRDRAFCFQQPAKLPRSRDDSKRFILTFSR